MTGAEARRGADGPPSEPRLDRGRRGEGGVAEQAALTAEAEAGGARCESRASYGGKKGKGKEGGGHLLTMDARVCSEAAGPPEGLAFSVRCGPNDERRCRFPGRAWGGRTPAAKQYKQGCLIKQGCLRLRPKLPGRAHRGMRRGGGREDKGWMENALARGESHAQPEGETHRGERCAWRRAAPSP